MGAARAICVTRDSRICRAVDDALGAVGVAVEHRDELPAEPHDFALAVVDRRVRETAGAALQQTRIPVVVVGDDLTDDGLITLMLEGPVRHLVSEPRPRELEVTSEKLVTRDVFGLEKYLARDAAVRERVVATDAGKRAAMAEVCAWAETIGARAPLVHRLANVVDELLMNALIDAPHEAGGDSARAVLRWGHDDKSIAVSVGDGYGALDRRDVIDNVRRARDERGRPQPATGDTPGAGLGLYLVLANVASLIVNVAPGSRTEVVCLFDRRAVPKAAQSLHVFEA
jgi:hypothetical protein